MEFTIIRRELHSRRAFRIARERRAPIENVFVCLEHAGIRGWGEASPSAFYQETAETVTAQLERAREFVARRVPAGVEELAALWQEVWPVVAPSRAAQCALDLAWWDWLARARGVTVAELAWGRAATPVTTFCTLGLAPPAEWPEKLAEVAGFPHLKLKSDRDADLTLARQVAALPCAAWAVDANCSWPAARVPELAAELAQLGCTFLEQPLPPAENHRLSLETSVLPVWADESCVTEDDLPGVAAHFAGYNVKLVKCGGLTPALRMVRQAAGLGRQVMVGCMLESSLLIAAGCIAAQGTQYADLDGAWLLADDPCRGWSFSRGVLQPPPGLGWGVKTEFDA